MLNETSKMNWCVLCFSRRYECFQVRIGISCVQENRYRKVFPNLFRCDGWMFGFYPSPPPFFFWGGGGTQKLKLSRGSGWDLVEPLKKKNWKIKKGREKRCYAISRCSFIVENMVLPRELSQHNSVRFNRWPRLDSMCLYLRNELSL